MAFLGHCCLPGPLLHPEPRPLPPGARARATLGSASREPLSRAGPRPAEQNPRTFRAIIWLECRAARVLLRYSWWDGVGDTDTGQRRRVSAGARRQLPCSPPRGLHPPASRSSPTLPAGAAQRQGQPGSLGTSWTWRPATPPCLQTPQKANRAPALEAPRFPTRFQVNSRCQLPCRAHQLVPELALTLA